MAPAVCSWFQIRRKISRLRGDAIAARMPGSMVYSLVITKLFVKDVFVGPRFDRMGRTTEEDRDAPSIPLYARSLHHERQRTDAFYCQQASPRSSQCGSGWRSVQAAEV